MSYEKSRRIPRARLIDQYQANHSAPGVKPGFDPWPWIIVTVFVVWVACNAIIEVFGPVI